MKKVLFIFFFVLFIIAILGLFWKKPKSVVKDSENSNGVADLIYNHTPTPMPFIDLTIPYLRNRKYVSKFESMEKVTETGSYISYRASYYSDGLKLYGQLMVPKGGLDIKYPAIVFIHGYVVPQNYRTTVNYFSYSEYLAKNGFVVFKIDLRGHDRSEGEASGAYYSSDYIVDTLNAYNALQNTVFVDPDRIGLWGHSMAGNIVLRSLVVKKDIPAVVIWSGAGYTYADISQYGINDDSYRPPKDDSDKAKKRRDLTNMYGVFDENSLFWKQVPATNYLEGVPSAIQINHAINDDVVNINYSRNLAKLLDSAHIVYELNEYETGGHNISGNVFTEAMLNTVEFFKKYL